MIKRVFGYLRVSGASQVEGDGFDRQRQAINAYCEAKGWHVTRFFQDGGVTGTKAAVERPAFAEMLALMGDQYDTIIVERADRLARDVLVSEVLIQQLLPLGIKVFDASADVDLTNSDDPTRVMIRQIMSIMAQWEKSVLVKKMKLAKDRMRMRGERAEGVLAWEKRSRENWEQAKAFVQFKKEGVTHKAMARYMNRKGIPLTGKLWGHSTIVSMIERLEQYGKEPQFEQPVSPVR